MIIKRLSQYMGIAGLLAVVGLAGSTAYAALTATSNLNQAITAGILSTDFRNGSDALVSSPTFTMSAVSVSNSQQTSTGTFGDATRRVAVDNPGGADGGWTLSLNATNPAAAKWTSGSDVYSFNGTAAAGQLTVNPAAGTLVAQVGGTTGVTLAAAAAPFTAATNTGGITLINAAASSADVWKGYVTGIGLTQTIPASTPVGSYSLPMTQTVATL